MLHEIAMSFRQTNRSLGHKPARLGVAAGCCVALLLIVGPAMAQGRGSHGGGMGGPHGGMGGRGGFMAPMPPVAHLPHIGLQLGLGGRWWDEGKTAKKLNLRADQQGRMDDIFEANKPTLITLYGNLQREEAKLVAMPPGDLQDETKVFAAIDRVAQARADLEKADAHILMQIRQQLDPSQLDALDREIAKTR
jgi:Spy/CpxP family protein refolding chaperone